MRSRKETYQHPESWDMRHTSSSSLPSALSFTLLHFACSNRKALRDIDACIDCAIRLVFSPVLLCVYISLLYSPFPDMDAWLQAPNACSYSLHARAH